MDNIFPLPPQANLLILYISFFIWLTIAVDVMMYPLMLNQEIKNKDKEIEIETKNNYKVYVNKQCYNVSRKIYLCHATRRIKTIKTNDFYNNFILNFQFKDILDIKNYISTYIDGISDKCKDILAKFKNLNYFYNFNFADDIILTSYIAEELIYNFNFYKTRKYYNLSTPQQINYSFIETRINYNLEDYSDAYKSLNPLLDFYHTLTIDYNNLFKCRDIIPYDYIDKVLKEGYGIKLEDIKKDIEEHTILLDIGKYYVWSSKNVKEWLFNLSTKNLVRYNLQKMLSSIRYEYQTKRDKRLINPMGFHLTH